MDHGLTNEDLDGRMVEIVAGETAHFSGLAAAREHGWIAVHLDALDPEDDRVLFPVLPEDVVLREDLE